MEVSRGPYRGGCRVAAHHHPYGAALPTFDIEQGLAALAAGVTLPRAGDGGYRHRFDRVAGVVGLPLEEQGPLGAHGGGVDFAFLVGAGYDEAASQPCRRSHAETRVGGVGFATCLRRAVGKFAVRLGHRRPVLVFFVIKTVFHSLTALSMWRFPRAPGRRSTAKPADCNARLTSPLAE